MGTVRLHRQNSDRFDGTRSARSWNCSRWYGAEEDAAGVGAFLNPMAGERPP